MVDQPQTTDFDERMKAGKWQSCHIGSCQRHQDCMYAPCRAVKVQSDTTSAVQKLLSAADEVIAMATELQHRGCPVDALACALFAAEYVRAARAMQNMKDARRA